MAYSLPNDVYLLVEEAFNHDRSKTQSFVRAVEASIQTIETHATQLISDKKETLKSEIYNELRTELATKEFVRAETSELKETLRAEISEAKASLKSEINELRIEVKQISLMLKVLIGLTVFGLTLFNPAFVKLVELLMK